MDFHGFARKELQALCKQNKIPANMTNVAMADALSSLDHVEGLWEIMDQRSNKSVEVSTPEVPKTATRTSTRGRKPPVSVLESGGAVASSRARMRTVRKVEDGDLVKDEVKGVEKTPAAASCRKIGGVAASSRRKVEVPSVQRVYSTRRSVRLVEKRLSELCLTDTVRRTRRPIKIDDELSGETTCGNIKGDQVKMEVLEECFERPLKDEANSSQKSTQALDAVVIAAHGCKALNGGVTHETRIDEVEKVIYEDCAKAVIRAIEGFSKVVNSIDNTKNLDTGMADAAAMEEVGNERTVDILKDDVDANAVGNFNDGGNGVSKADEVFVKSISMDCADVLGDMDHTAVCYESTGIADPVAIEDQCKDVISEKASPANITEQELRASEVVQSDVIADHVPDSLNEKKYDFDSAANQDSKFESVLEHDSEESFHSSAENVQAYYNVPTKIPTEAVTQGQLSEKKTVTKELPLASENTNKENIASIIKAEESSKVPKTPYKEMSFRKLLKTFKELTINQETEATADANNLIAKQQQPRKALQTIPANSQKH